MTDTMLDKAVAAIMDCGPVGCCIISEREAREIARAALEAIKVNETPDDYFSDSDWDWNYRIDAILSETPPNG